MNNAEAVARIVAASRVARSGSEVNQLQARFVLSQYRAEITATLVKGGSVTVDGLGLLRTSIAKARTGRHPITGVPIAIPRRKTVKLRLAPKMKSRLG